MPDDLIDGLKDQMAPAWSEERSSDVLRRVRIAREERRAARRRLWTGLTGVVAAAAVAAVLLFFYRPFAAGPSPSDDGVAAAAVVTWTDGSRAVLRTDAQVQTEEESLERTVVRQESGSVRYEVVPGQSRLFEVRVEDVTVQVLGTVFTVRRGERDVSVDVTRGHVRVVRGTEVTDLHAGQQVEIAFPRPRQEGLGAADVDPPPTSLSQREQLQRNASTERLSSAPRSARTTDARRTPRGTRSETGDVEERLADGASVDDLLVAVDRERRAGRFRRARAKLRAIVSERPSDPQLPMVLFTLARVEASLGNTREAAEAYRRCARRAPGGSLAEDAVAGEASAWRAAGAHESALRAAQSYLTRFPQGLHRDRMQRIVSNRSRDR